MEDVERTPVSLLTGFLGSGKTTLLNALLKAPEFANTAVIVNEFGAIGLDHYLIEQGSDNVVLLEAGCLCCTIADSLDETLADLHSRRVRGAIPPFARVIIETTGLADPAPILNTLLGHRLVTDAYRLEAVVVTVDGEHALAEMTAQPEVVKQIAVADRLVVTKLDAAPSAQALFTRLAELNPRAGIVESRHGDGALAAFAPIARHRVTVDVAARHAGHHDHAHGHHEAHDVNRHDARVRAHCFVIDTPISWSGIAAWWRIVSGSFGDRLLRCKGIVRIADTGEIAFLQGVQRFFHRPERLTGWPDADHRSRIVCITRDVDEEELCQTLPVLALPPGTDPNVPLAQLTEGGFRR